MAHADRLTIDAGFPGIRLMERAGAAVASAAGRMVGRDGRIVVTCGPGNNGGDGFVAARLLQRRGYGVELGLFGRRDTLRGDAAEAAREFEGSVVEASALRFEAADLVIDALFGAGLARDLDGDALRLVERMNAAGTPILAVDVPSGVDGNTGVIRGAAVQAVRSVTFFRRKPGHLLFPGRLRCGEVEVADIGIDAAVLEEIRPATFENGPDLWRAQFPRPSLDGHKYSRGHVLAVSGSLLHTGAARLAAMGALRAGAGLVTLASPGDALLANAAHLTAVMLTRCDGAADLGAILADRRKNVAVLGPGLGVGGQTRALVEAVLASADDGPAVVLDADALTSFAGDAVGLARLIGGRPVVMTPHGGEFGRLFEAHGAVEAAVSKLDAARRAAEALGAIVVYKGPDTVVAAPDGRASIGCDLPPWLATAGSGDVLAGICGGLMAQRMAPFEAASCAVWMHGAAARAFGPGLISEDLPVALAQVVAELVDERSRSTVRGTPRARRPERRG